MRAEFSIISELRIEEYKDWVELASILNCAFTNVAPIEQTHGNTRHLSGEGKEMQTTECTDDLLHLTVRYYATKVLWKKCLFEKNFSDIRNISYLVFLTTIA